MSVHCPYCNATKVAGQGMVVLDNAQLVQYRCQECGELFFTSDRRSDQMVQLQPPARQHE